MHLPPTDALYNFLPGDVKGLTSLAALALDMQRSRSHGTDPLWRNRDPELWDRTHNPWALLQTVSRGTLRARPADREFRDELNAHLTWNREAAQTQAWFQAARPAAPLTCAAFFSVEFMLGETLLDLLGLPDVLCAWQVQVGRVTLYRADYYTVRIISSIPGLAMPPERNLILWQR